MRGGGRRGQEARGGRPPARPGSPSLRPPRFPRRVRAFPAALHVFMAREIQTLRTHLARRACTSTSSAPPCRAGRKTLTQKMKRIDPTERTLGQARAARGYAQGARSLNVVFFFILPLLILTHNSRWGRREGVRSGRTWPRALSRPLSGRSQFGGHSAAAQSGRTTICRSFSFPTGAQRAASFPDGPVDRPGVRLPQHRLPRCGRGTRPTRP